MSLSGERGTLSVTRFVQQSLHDLSEGLIGEVVDIVTRAAVAAVESGEERITSTTVMALGYVPLSRRRNSALRHSMT